jgi:AcrR family transcriptional regulator
MRRVKRRAETVAAIKSLALTQLAEVGGAGLNLRAIARDLEMSSAGIYRYYASRDELLVALITDGFDSLGARLRSAVSDDAAPADQQLIELLGAYRTWAKESPQMFALLFTDPVPGFAAPKDGPTTQAVRRALWPLTSTAAAVIDPTWAHGPRHGDGALPAHVLSGLFRVWSGVHGLVSLELFHHLDWAHADLDAEFDRLVTDLVEQLPTS